MCQPCSCLHSQIHSILMIHSKEEACNWLESGAYDEVEDLESRDYKMLLNSKWEHSCSKACWSWLCGSRNPSCPLDACLKESVESQTSSYSRNSRKANASKMMMWPRCYSQAFHWSGHPPLPYKTDLAWLLYEYINSQNKDTKIIGISFLKRNRLSDQLKVLIAVTSEWGMHLVRWTNVTWDGVSDSFQRTADRLKVVVGVVGQRVAQGTVPVVIPLQPLFWLINNKNNLLVLPPWSA